MLISDILQPTHLLLILVVALLVLGPKRLPEVGRAIGRGLHDFKGAIDDVKPAGLNEMVGPDAKGTSGTTPDGTV
jgi:sec-independent protein translocase protein TatA